MPQVPDEQVFAPERMNLRTETIYTVIGMLVVGPALMWWKEVPLKWALVLLPITLVFVVAGDVYKARIRGRDFIYVVPQGIRVTNRRKVWLMRWQEIHKVYRMKDQLIFETVPPHRRETLSLEGHDAHLKELAAAVAARTSTMNFGWLETLTDLL
jgi:hypothetical protein